MSNKDKQLYILKTVFPYISEIKKLGLIKYNKNLQNIFNKNLINYKIKSGKCKIGERNGNGKEYNINDELIFEGEYLNGKRNGNGKEYNDDSIIIFEGEYLN